MIRRLYLGIALVASVAGSAQWNPNTAVNTPVATGTTDDLQSITGPSGRTYTAMFQPTGSGYSPRLQILNEQGVPRLGTNGMQFNNTTSMGSYTVTWDFRSLGGPCAPGKRARSGDGRGPKLAGGAALDVALRAADGRLRR